MPAQGTAHPTVLLRHERPDGSVHVDWLIGRDPAGQEPLVSFRIDDRVDNMTPGTMLPAVRIADHRARYLDYEGPIDADRGSVRRLARGSASVIGDPDSSAWAIDVHWLSASQKLALERIDGDRWQIRVVE
ncbi:MAG: hypothetical protein HKO59_14135 [Phycisphaerales bacterium]|nr:hypothetical protein [Phycisphaerae bacterium]NNF42356.1 hypothetical protein [Phycisphaerales bacterium]NNM27100.1 hypothetical protein [Phycisphaerales bacterium]